MKTEAQIRERIKDLNFYINFAKTNMLDMGEWMIKAQEELCVLMWILESEEE